jgi:hypothetical protein
MTYSFRHIVNMQYYPITSVEAERSFSRYKGQYYDQNEDLLNLKI